MLPSIHGRRMPILRCHGRPGRFCICWRARPTLGRLSSSAPHSVSRPCTLPPHSATMEVASSSPASSKPAKIARARANIAAGGLADLVEIREGDALQTLAQDLPELIDLLLLDGAKGLYPDILSPRLSSDCGLAGRSSPIMPDWNPDYLARVRLPGPGLHVGPLRGKYRTVDAGSGFAKGHRPQRARVYSPPRGDR